MSKNVEVSYSRDDLLADMEPIFEAWKQKGATWQDAINAIATIFKRTWEASPYTEEEMYQWVKMNFSPSVEFDHEGEEDVTTRKDHKRPN